MGRDRADAARRAHGCGFHVISWASVRFGMPCLRHRLARQQSAAIQNDFEQLRTPPWADEFQVSAVAVVLVFQLVGSTSS